MSTLYSKEWSIKIIKYEFTRPLQRDEKMTSRYIIWLSMKPYVMYRGNEFSKPQSSEKKGVVLHINIQFTFFSFFLCLQSAGKRDWIDHWM